MSQAIGVYKNLLIEYLIDLSDAEQQKRTWLNINNPDGLVYSFSDNVNDIFYGTGLSDALDSGKIVFSSQIDSVLKELGDEIDKVNIELPEDELYYSDEIKKIRQLSANLVQLIKASDGSESTVEIIE